MVRVPEHDRYYWTFVLEKKFTDASGHYSFDDLPGGEYIVWSLRGDQKYIHVTLPQDYIASFVR